MLLEPKLSLPHSHEIAAMAIGIMSMFKEVKRGKGIICSQDAKISQRAQKIEQRKSPLLNYKYGN